MFAAGADAAAGVAFAVAVDTARLRLPSAFGFLAFSVPIEVATASGGPRALLRVETIATRPALSSRVAVANVQANAEDIVETRDARCAHVVVRPSRRTRHRINQSFYFAVKNVYRGAFCHPPPGAVRLPVGYVPRSLEHLRQLRAERHLVPVRLLLLQPEARVRLTHRVDRADDNRRPEVVNRLGHNRVVNLLSHVHQQTQRSFTNLPPLDVLVRERVCINGCIEHARE